MTHHLLRFTALFTFAWFGYATASAQTAPTFSFEFNQKPGPYAVGLKIVEQYDRSRSFQAAPVLPTVAAATEGPRPLQTLVWYPATKSGRATMTFGEYGAFIKTETSFSKPVEQGKPQAFVEAFMHGTTNLHAWAVQDAPMQPGQYPS
jgi:hypothetical protein